VEYPLEDVVNTCGRVYFNSTVAYPICLAIHERAESIALFGADYSFPHKHFSEKGRGCCEYWLGVASARGIKINVAKGSTLMDADQDEGPYGYDGFRLHWQVDENGYQKLIKKEKPLPTADDIEARYDKTGNTKEAA